MNIRKKTVALAAAALVILLWIASFFSPEGAIRRYMFLHLHPVSAFTSQITDMERYDPQYGHLYDVSGYVDRAAREEVPVFYLRKKGPFWFVESTGSGP